MSPVLEAADVVVENGDGALQAEVSAGGIRFLADEPVEAGGLGGGPTPYQLLAAALGSCTVITLKSYAAHKRMALARVRVRVRHERDPASRTDVFHREIRLGGDLSEADRARLIEIAERCPVHRTLSAGVRVETSVAEPPARSDLTGLAA